MTLKKLLLGMTFALFVTSAALASETSPNRGKVDLDGTWNFATDPGSIGETQNWFQPDFSLPAEQPEGFAPKEPGKIQIPGIWDAQGYGTPTDKVKHNYVGKAWYKRTCKVPADWNPNDSIYFVLTGISRYAKVWINGRLIGPEAIGPIGSFEWNVSEFVRPGEDAEITMEIDSKQRWDVDPLLGAAQLNDYLLIVWGGVWGHVYLEARPQTRIDSIYLRSDIENSVCSVDATLIDETNTEFDGFLQTEVIDKNNAVVAQDVSELKKTTIGKGSEATVSVKVPNARLWSPEDPYLYKVRVSLMDQEKKTLDVRESTYGMREIKFVGSQIFLNGSRYFLRGYGDDHIYPVEFSMPTDINMYRERLAIIKSFGFNHCRHHSCVLPHEYYDACDELGVMPNAEMLLGYPGQLPGEGDLWKSNVPQDADPEPALNTLRERFAAVVKEFRNHPSIFVWVGGNEDSMLGWDRWLQYPLRKDFQKIAKTIDPDRYFVDCDGDFLNEANAKGLRDTEDMAMLLFDEWSNPIWNRDKFKTEKLDRPAISHESGNFLTFSRPDQIDLFENTNYKPFWMTDGKSKLDELGLANEVEDWARASEKLYYTLHKYNVEGVRRNDELSGYHWWLIQDYWTTSNGLVDLFFRPKSIKPEEVRKINGPVVLLQNGLQFAYVAGDKIDVEALVSNFCGVELTNSLSWSIESADETFSKGEFSERSIAGKLTSVGKIAALAPEVTTATRATLRLTTKNPATGEIYSNDWTTYFYPRKISPKNDAAIYSDTSTIGFFPKDWNVKSLEELQARSDSADELPANAVYAVSWATQDVVDAVKRGAGLLNFNAQQFLSSIGMRYQQTWWKAGDSEESNNTGTFVYPNPVTDGVTGGDWCDEQWGSLLDNGQKFNLESALPRPKVFIRALSSLVRVRDQAILFEVGIGKGKMIVSGLNCAAAGDFPLNRWILARSVDEVLSENPAEVSWNADLLTPPIKTPKGTILGVQRILKFSEKSSWNSYKSLNQSVPNWVCRQNKKENEVVWQTVPISKDVQEDMSKTFIFAGGLGYATQSKTDGFVMSFNGKDLINFDVVDLFDGKTNEFVWKSDDGRSELRFDARAELAPNDKYGVFRLIVPNDLICPGDVQTIGVRSLGEGSSRWFGLNWDSDFSDIEE